MKSKDRFYMAFAKIFPPRYKAHIKQLIKYSGETTNVDIYLGSATVIAILVFIACLFIPGVLGKDFHYLYLSYSVLGFLLVQLAAYLIYFFRVEDRTKRVEEILPDALQLIAANVRAGMTPFQAMKRAGRKEFGPLADEINYTTSRALGTESFSDLLLSISERIKSELLARAIELFTTSLRSGGHLAKLLEELAIDAEETRSLKRELVTSTKTYIAFIMFTIIIGAPLLLAVSIQFIEIISGMQAKAQVSSVGFGMSFLAGEIAITPSFFFKVSIVMLILTSLLAAMLLGSIAEGKPLYGFRYAPTIMIGSVIVFFICRFVINNFFSGMI
ncbi:MAG: type II secretion system F family protein [Candidatus Woesearchaeota archaeon]